MDASVVVVLDVDAAAVVDVRSVADIAAAVVEVTLVVVLALVVVALAVEVVPLVVVAEALSEEPTSTTFTPEEEATILARLLHPVVQLGSSIAVTVVTATRKQRNRRQCILWFPLGNFSLFVFLYTKLMK